MESNAKLLAVRAEIEAILKKNDIGAHVVLHMIAGKTPEHTEGYTETFGFYEPSYSCLKPLLDSRGVMIGLHLRSKIEDYNGDAEAQRRDIEATSNMVSSMAVLLANDALSMIDLSKRLDAITGAEHTGLRDINQTRG